MREAKTGQPEQSAVKVIKAPKFAQKVYEKSIKINLKSGRNESNIDNKFCFVFQPNQPAQTNQPNSSAKAKMRLTCKRNS